MAHPFITVCAISGFALTSGCASYDRPDNIEPVASGGGYQAQYREPHVTRANADFLRSADINAEKCLPYGAASRTKGAGKGSTTARLATRLPRL